MSKATNKRHDRDEEESNVTSVHSRRNNQLPERDEEGRFMSEDDSRYDDNRSSSRYRSRADEDEGRSRSARASNRPRDEEGRFMEEDDDRHYASRGRYRDEDSGGYRSSSRNDNRYSDDDGRYSRSARANRRPRDEEGRFMSEDDDRYYSSRNRYREEDSGGYRSSSRGRYRNEDDRYYRSRGDDYDQRHTRSGWYGDSRGHAEAARRGWDNPDHGPSGWYGDSRRHSEASRRGWDNRRYYDED